MAIIKKIDRTDKREIRDHMENTAKDLVKCYTLSQLSLMDGIDIRTIKSSWRYLPVRIDNSKSLYAYKNWQSKKPYMVMYIRLDEVRFLFNKKTHKKLVIE